jgi:hypothetical protein
MKRTLIASVAALATIAGAASAMTVPYQGLEKQVQQYVPNADLSTYSDGALVQIRGILDGNSDSSESSIKAQLRGALRVLQ